MPTDRLLTLAIHTYQRALATKQLLEDEGIAVELNNVNLQDPELSAGVRVRIHEADLPQALRIVENPDIFPPKRHDADGTTQPGLILVPTDLSDGSRRAVGAAFSLASSLGCHLLLLHSYIAPQLSTLPLTEAYRYGEKGGAESAASPSEARAKAQQALDSFVGDLRQLIKEGTIPAVPFTTEVAEGLPEEVILEYSRQKAPRLIVMATRGKDRKGSELIGSVTAEVLDSCRIPTFTIPETVDLHELSDLRRVAFFCNLDQEDMLAIDTLRRLFPQMKVDVTLIHIPGRRESRAQNRQEANNLLRYCQQRYGDSIHFDLREVALGTIFDDMKHISDELPFHLICLPNKRQNVFTRLFNPSLPHKILFQADIPMMVIPV